jgi:hypothetical protein
VFEVSFPVTMFSVSGKGSVLKCDIFPPVDLDYDSEWEVGLINLCTYNSIPNIEKDVNDKIYFGSINATLHQTPDAVGDISNDSPPPAARSAISYTDEEQQILEKDIDAGNITITIPQGAYELEDIENYILNTCSRAKIPLDFKLKANNNTLHSELFSSRPVDFTRPNSIAELLGFDERVLKPNRWHISERSVNIIRVNSIRVVCSIVQGSFDNGSESHIIHEFQLAVDPGYKIIETPANVIYLPVNTRKVQSIVIRLEDQNGRLVNFANETISLRLHLRKRNGSRS